MNKVYKYVQRRQMSDVCLKLTDDINLWQKIVPCFGSRCKVNNGWIQTSSICPTSSECANFVLLYIFRMFQVLNKGGKFLQERERTNAVHCSALQLHANEDRTRAGKAFPTSLHEISSTMLRPIIGNFLRSQ